MGQNSKSFLEFELFGVLGNTGVGGFTTQGPHWRERCDGRVLHHALCCMCLLGQPQISSLCFWQRCMSEWDNPKYCSFVVYVFTFDLVI
eukprot:3620651-Amphidinium_carterae.1